MPDHGARLAARHEHDGDHRGDLRRPRPSAAFLGAAAIAVAGGFLGLATIRTARTETAAKTEVTSH